MTWANFYLICFALGFTLSLFSFLLGGSRLHFRSHAHGIHLGHAGMKAGSLRGSGVSVLSPVSIAAFLAWFGGIGYLFTRYSTVWLVVGLGLALLSGVTGAAIIYLFLSRVLTSENENLDPADFEMVGVLGRISAPIREGGTGELIYSQAGSRRVCGARAENGAAIPKDSEVIVTRYEKGISYVCLWAEVAEDADFTESSNRRA